MDLGVRAQESSLSGVFGPGERLCMPPYQRSYSWEKREALDLLSDLLSASDNGTPHFVGAIVLVASREDGIVEIVDGQQRLTTLTILLAVLRDLETDKDLKAELQSLLADEARPMLGEAATWRLTLNHMDGPFFRATIQSPNGTLELQNEPGESESQQRMVQNAAAFVKEIQKLTDKRRRALANTVCNGCAIVRVIVQDRDSGFRVFRVLNTRGKEPNAHDIIKTELFERAKFNVVEAEKFAEQWQEHEAFLGGNAFDDLLRQIRAMYDKSPKGELVAGFRKAVLTKIPPREFLTNILPSYVTAYGRITTGEVGDTPQAKEISKHLNRLRALEAHGWRAPAIKFMATRGPEDPSAPEFFKMLERLGYKIQLIVSDRDQRNKRYRKVIDACDNDKALFGRSSSFTVTKDEGRKMRERLLGRFATFGQRRSMALRLNAALEGGVTLPPETDATVEHVLPRNIQEGSYWLTTWPDPQKRRELCDALGNFVLLTHKVNQKADRLDFRAKKDVYFSDAGGSDFALTRDLKDQDVWTADVVRRRTERLAEILAEEWELP
jgi:hypothetical protein